VALDRLAAAAVVGVGKSALGNCSQAFFNCRLRRLLLLLVCRQLCLLTAGTQQDDAEAAAALLSCRNTTLEKHCAAMLDAEYGPTAANMIRNAGLLEHPLRLTVNADWDNQVNGERQVCGRHATVLGCFVLCKFACKAA
jgi:hypothetical protein